MNRLVQKPDLKLFIRFKCFFPAWKIPLDFLDHFLDISQTLPIASHKGMASLNPYSRILWTKPLFCDDIYCRCPAVPAIQPGDHLNPSSCVPAPYLLISRYQWMPGEVILLSWLAPFFNLIHNFIQRFIGK